MWDQWYEMYPAVFTVADFSARTQVFLNLLYFFALRVSLDRRDIWRFGGFKILTVYSNEPRRLLHNRQSDPYVCGLMKGIGEAMYLVALVCAGEGSSGNVFSIFSAAFLWFEFLCQKSPSSHIVNTSVIYKSEVYYTLCSNSGGLVW